MNEPKFKIGDLVKVYKKNSIYKIIGYSSTAEIGIKTTETWFWYRMVNLMNEKEKLSANEGCLDKVVNYNDYWAKLNE